MVISGRRALVGAAAILVAAALTTTSSLPAAPAEAAAHGKRATVKRFPWEKRTRAAAQFANRRAGSVSFALIDEFGRIHAHSRGSQYSSASLVKAMLLVAYL